LHPICIKMPKALWHRERCYNRSMPEGRRLVGLGLADPTRLAFYAACQRATLEMEGAIN